MCCFDLIFVSIHHDIDTISNRTTFYPCYLIIKYICLHTTGTTHYSVGKYLWELLNPLTQKMYTVKDSFDQANKINQILPNVQKSDEYAFVSLDVISLFTNVPLKKTVDIILKLIYTDKEITTTLTKRSLKKLILDTCQKTAFSFNGKM